MISKKLMSEIMNDKVKSIKIMNDTIFIYFENNDQEYFIETYELAFRARDYFKIKNNHLSLNQSIEEIFKEANSIYESLSSK